jgi:quinol monooxygenase YgiN
MPNQPIVLINLLKAHPGKQPTLMALLKKNTDTVVKTLAGWRSTHLIAAEDGESIVIYSEWKSLAAVDAMRSDERMKAYLPKILELGSLESVIGSVVATQTAGA